MKTTYQRPVSTRREARAITGRFRGGKLNPTMVHIVRESESAVLRQSITAELDPIAGRMITPITFEVFAVHVPAQAMHALASGDEYAGNTEIMRDKLVSGAPLFGVEAENELSQRMGVVPRSVNGSQFVSTTARLGHNAAVNYLRKRKYTYASQVAMDNYAVTPALISQTVLDRLNGVLDPEDHVNGTVSLKPTNYTRAYVSGIGVDTSRPNPGTETLAVQERVYERTYDEAQSLDHNGNRIKMRMRNGGERPEVFVETKDIPLGNISTEDFYKAEVIDRITRKMRQVVDQNPEQGEEMLQRWAHGLSVDDMQTPVVVYHTERIFGANVRTAMDGANLDVQQTDLALRVDFTVPIMATELGGVIVTFAVVKPDETLSSQPHPFLSEEWVANNYVSDELATDPEPVRMRALDADIDQAAENTVAFYTGHNALKRTYVNYGLARNLDPSTVENKTALWQLEVPMSVTPESILYPENLPHYPFADQEAEVCTYTIQSSLTVSTPLQFGPTPVEDMDIIDTARLFEDD